MSKTSRHRLNTGPSETFAALGDPIRLWILWRLGDGQPKSITSLWIGTPVTRQAVTRHLRVLQDAGLVDRTDAGRETRFTLRPERLNEARAYLESHVEELERQHRRGYERHPVVEGEFDVWQAEQKWGEE